MSVCGHLKPENLPAIASNGEIFLFFREYLLVFNGILKIWLFD